MTLQITTRLSFGFIVYCLLSLYAQGIVADTCNIQTLGGKFQTMRTTVEGSERSNWGGQLHMLMLEIERCLGASSQTRLRLLEILGPADVSSSRGETFYLRAASSNPELVDAADEVLIYWWRKNLDFLYFGFDKDTMTMSGWWHAYE